MNPEDREIDILSFLSPHDTGLLGKKVIVGYLKEERMIPITVGKNFSIYYGGRYHADMVRDPNDVLLEAYAKYKDGKVILEVSNHHVNEGGRELIEATQAVLAKEFEKLMKQNDRR
jgi:hypothetical protein